MSPPPMRPAVDGHNGRPISWPSHPTRTRSARHGFGPPLGPAGREAAVITWRHRHPGRCGPAPLHRPTASIRAATRRTAMPSAGEAEALHRFTRLRHRFGLRHAVRRCRQRVKLRDLHRFTRLRHRFGLRHAVRRCPQRVKLSPLQRFTRLRHRIPATRRPAMPSAGEAEGGGGRRRLGRRIRYGGQLSERCATGLAHAVAPVTTTVAPVPTQTAPVTAPSAPPQPPSVRPRRPSPPPPPRSPAPLHPQRAALGREVAELTSIRWSGIGRREAEPTAPPRAGRFHSSVSKSARQLPGPMLLVAGAVVLVTGAVAVVRGVVVVLTGVVAVLRAR